MDSIAVTWRLLVLAACAALALAFAAASPGVADAQTGIDDRWSGVWKVTFTTSGDGRERSTGELCCVTISPLSDEQGRAYVNGTTGDPRNGVFTDVVCAGAAPRRFWEARSPFEWLSGHVGPVPGPDRPTEGAFAILCSDDTPDAIRGHYRNDLGAFDPLISKPVAEGSLLARRSGGPQGLEGSLTHFPGDFPGPTFGTEWTGTCISGPCRQVQRRPTLRVRRLSNYNALLSFLRGPRGARFELARADGSARPLRTGETIDLEDGDVVTSHGMYAEVVLTRFDGTVVTIAMEPGGSIAGVADPGLVRHRGGRISIDSSVAGFTSDSEIFSPGPNEAAGEHAVRTIRTSAGRGARVLLELDPARRTLLARALRGTVTVRGSGAPVTLAAGQEARASATAVRRIGPPPDLARTIVSPVTLRGGPVALSAPRRIGTRSLARARCLRTTLTATGAARIAVSLLTGTARRGALVVQSRLTVTAGTNRAVCLPLGAKARGLPAGTPLTIALGVRVGSRRTLATRPVILTSS